jgi:hypothetical protein
MYLGGIGSLSKTNTRGYKGLRNNNLCFGRIAQLGIVSKGRSEGECGLTLLECSGFWVRCGSVHDFVAATTSSNTPAPQNST